MSIKKSEKNNEKVTRKFRVFTSSDDEIGVIVKAVSINVLTDNVNKILSFYDENDDEVAVFSEWFMVVRI